MDISCVLSLPRDSLCDVLNSWLTLKDIVKFDTACCQSRCRKELHSATAGVLRVSHTVVSEEDAVNWLVKRKASVLSMDLRNLFCASEPFVTSCCQYLTHLGLSLDPTAKMDSAFIKNLLVISGQIESVKFSGDYPEEVVSALLCRMHALKRINGLYESELIQTCANSCPLLEEFLGSMVEISDPGMIELAQKCPRLKVVRRHCFRRHTTNRDRAHEFIAHCPNLTELCVGPLPDSAMLKLGACCPQLTVLQCENDGSRKEAQVPALSALALGCPLLRKLTLTHFTSLTGSMLCPLTNLEELRVHYSEEMGDSDVTAMAQSCTNLSFVELCDCSGVTEKGALALITGLPKLRTLLLHSEAYEYESKRTAGFRMAQKLIDMHYPLLKYKLEFDERNDYGYSDTDEDGFDDIEFGEDYDDDGDFGDDDD